MNYMISKKRISLIIAIFMVLCISLGGRVMKCSAAEPKVMLTDYEVNPEEVKSGDAFTLTITLENTANKKIKNMKVSIISEDGNLLPASGAGTAYFKEINAEATQEVAFDMKAVSGLEQKSYKLTVKSEYEDVNGVPYTVQDTVYVPIVLDTRISITEAMCADDAKIGDEAEIIAMVNNLGEAPIRNVAAYIDGKCIEPQSVYVGNLESGKSGNIDIITKTKMVTTSASEAKCTLTVIYEDGNGNKYEEKSEVYVYVQSSSYENLEVLKEDSGAKLNTTIIVLVVIAVLVIALLIIKIIKHRKKKRLLEDF